MDAKKQKIVLGTLLKKLNTGKRTVTTEEVEADLEDAGDSRFGGSANADAILSSFEEERLVVKLREDVYRIVADISHLRSRAVEADGEQDDDEPVLSREDFLKSVWTLSDKRENADSGDNAETDDDDNETDDDDVPLDFRNLRKEFERQRRRRLFEEDEAESEAIDALEKCMEVYHEDDEVIVTADDSGDEPVLFRMTKEGSALFLTDGGATEASAAEFANFCDPSVAEKVDGIAKRYGVRWVGGTFCIYLEEPEHAVRYLMRLFAATECILTLAKELANPDAVPAPADEETDDEEPAAPVPATPVPEPPAPAEPPIAVRGERAFRRAAFPSAEYRTALAVAVKLGIASIALIQRRCAVGYAHAGKIVEWMENMGYITPYNGAAGARAVLLTPHEFEKLYGPLD